MNVQYLQHLQHFLRNSPTLILAFSIGEFSTKVLQVLHGLRPKMNILDLIQIDGNTALKRVSSTYGGEYAGACPFCGGQDRFRAWPESNRFWCRGCGKKGDSIQFLRDRRGLGYLKACHELNIAPRTTHARLTPHPQVKALWEPKPLKAAPCDQWQDQARSFLDKCKKFLWSDQGAKYRAYLTGRGVTPGIVELAGLGWNQYAGYHNPGAWGLPGQKNQKGEEKRLWLPAGLVIPYTTGRDIVRLRIRRDSPGKGSRFILATGSDTRPMISGPDHPVFLIIESELDALTLWLDTAHLVTVIALGSAQIRPDAELHESLLKAERILVALDSDQAGAKESLWWLKQYKQALRWPVPAGKDPGEAFQQGVDLPVWVQAGLEVDHDL